MLTLKEINKLAIPAILYNIVEPLLGLIDTAVVGQMNENVTISQAGIGLAAGLISTLVWGLAQIRTAVSAIVSQYLGGGELDKIKSLIPQSLYFSAIVGFVFWIITAYFFIPIADVLFINKSPDVLIVANDYYQIRAVGLPLSLLIAGFFGVFRGLQNTKFAMYAAFTGAIVNIVLDLVLVNGFKTIPAMGVAGVAWASVLAQLSMVLVCVFFLLKKTPFHLKITKTLNEEFNNMLLISGNMLLRTLALNLSFILALRFASKHGEETIAAYSIGIQIWLFSSFFIDGYATAGNAMAGKYLGEKNIEKLKYLVQKLLKINIWVAVFLSLTYLILYNVLGGWFTDNKEVILIFNSFLWVIILVQPLNSIAYTMDGVFKGMGKAKLLRNTLLIGTFGVFIPSLFITNYFDWGVMSIWFAFVCWMSFRGVTLLYWFFKKTLISVSR